MSPPETECTSLLAKKWTPLYSFFYTLARIYILWFENKNPFPISSVLKEDNFLARADSPAARGPSNSLW